MLTSCHQFTAETSSWHDFIPGPWISGSVAYGAPLLDANLRGLCTNSWLCSGQHVAPWESMVALPWSLLTKHRKFRPRSQLFDLYGSLAVIFIIFMSCRLRILGNAKHLGFWETWAYLSFIRFIVGTRGSQFLHEDHACVFCRHPWQFSLTDRMSKHLSAYMSGDVETPLIVRIFSGSFLRNWMESIGNYVLYGYIRSEQSTTSTIILSPYLHIQTVHFLTFCHRLCLIVTVTVYTGICYTESESGNQYLV